MKRTGVIICLVTLMVMITSAFSFGATSLKLDKTYPKDGQTSTTKENMVVKLYFNEAVGNEESQKANAKTFKITDNKGKELPTIIKYNPEDNTQAMVLVDTTDKSYDAKTIKDDTDYTMTLSGDFVANDGTSLGKDVTVTFTTMNQGQSTKIYMIMMVVMFAGMFIFSSRSMKKQREKENEVEEKEPPFNPYKEAKRTGKSVAEVTAEYQKEQAKKAAKAARKASRQRAIEEEDYEDPNTYRVKAPKPISAAGGKYVTGRKAIAEAKAAEKEKRKQQAAANKKKK